jgi:hypothetical protein
MSLLVRESGNTETDRVPSHEIILVYLVLILVEFILAPVRVRSGVDMSLGGLVGSHG